MHPDFVVSPLDYGLWRQPGLRTFLGAPLRICVGAAAPEAVRVGWGRKRSGRRAERLSARNGSRKLLLEDGFLRSIGFGPGEPPLSLVLDDRGIYYDATAPSRLEALIGEPLSSAQSQRAADLMRAWREGRVSKYNQAREYRGPLPEKFVLVVDQTYGDASIHCGLASASSFARMLRAALAENPLSDIVLKTHPEVAAGRKAGHFDLAALAADSRVRLLGEDVHPAGLLERAESVYTVTSQMGFEALIWQRPVRTFGMPFYAGWGLTGDELPRPNRRGKATLEQLVHAALVAYPRYRDPETGRRCEPERVMEWLALQRRMRERFPPRVYACGFSPWKKPIVREFFQGSHVEEVPEPARLPSGATLARWGRKPLPSEPPAGTAVVRLEDGFLRSVGLGADLVRPLSWVMDRRGIYYDASEPSDLEHLLATAEFSEELRDRAEALRIRIVKSGLTKYNVGAAAWQRPPGAGRVILVPGQVESDASIHYGAPGICTNLALLQAVRKRNPDACVVYKPHPDVIAGLRVAADAEAEARQWCDVFLVNAGMGDLLEKVDEVHVLTSLAGFEALLREKPVACYGLPFYAGWGLTRDELSLERRHRRLSLAELVAAALILYPVYVSRRTGRFATPEAALDELLLWRAAGAASASWRSKLLRPILRAFLRR